VALGALSAVDLTERTLPRRAVRATVGALLVALVALAAATGGFGHLWVALAGGLGLFAIFLLVRFALPGALGGGDVRLAGLVGLATGWWGAGALLAVALHG